MARTADALVEPSLLQWARKSAGFSLSEAAVKIGVDLAVIERWEAGSSKPTFAQLRKAATVYKRPLAVFYLSEPPTDFQPLRDYRTHSGDRPIALSPELHLRIRETQNIRENALELAELADEPIEPVPRVSAETARDPERFGETLRGLLNVNLATQRTWTGEYDALKGWVEAVERIGVLVSQAGGVEVEEFRALSLPFETLPVIVVNPKDSPRARVFSLLHELAHVLLRQGGLCDLEGRGLYADLEIFCNAVAAAALMPKEAFLAEPVVRDAPRAFAPWDPSVVQSIGRKYSVSEEAALRRLLTLGKTTRAHYEERRAELRRIVPRETEGGPPVHIRRLSELGPRFVGLALEAYDSGAINISDLSSYLGLKVRHIEPLRSALRGRLLS